MHEPVDMYKHLKGYKTLASEFCQTQQLLRINLQIGSFQYAVRRRGITQLRDTSSMRLIPTRYTHKVSVLVNTVPHLSSIDWYTYLARPRLPGPSTHALNSIADRSIFITGAGGSIGSLLSLRIARLKPRRLTLLDISEQALYRLRISLEAENLTDQVTLLLGSVADHLLLREAFSCSSPDILFHAAAHKHLPLIEEYALAAIANNTLATNMLLCAAAEYKISRTILLSTDKAVSPTSILGATKSVAEMDTLCHRGIVVRLVNVLGTEGSVVPAFLKQIENHQPITITDPKATRYFLTSEEAVDLLLTASIESAPATTLVPAIRSPQSILDLAHFLLTQLASPCASTIRYVGLGVGEKRHENLWSEDEEVLAESLHGSLQVVARQRPIYALDRINTMLGPLRIAVASRNLPEAMDHMQSLVPGYTPSETILRQIRIHAGVAS